MYLWMTLSCARGVSMLFSGTVALDNVDYNVWRGKVNVIIGENGAGKSTLMKILAGVQQPSLGEIELNGKPVQISSTRAAAGLGIGMVHQELNLFENLNVAENIFLGRELQKDCPYRRSRTRKRTAELLKASTSLFPQRTGGKSESSSSNWWR
jgi:erythritol transport system ATP-binding protein